MVWVFLQPSPFIWKIDNLKYLHLFDEEYSTKKDRKTTENQAVWKTKLVSLYENLYYRVYNNLLLCNYSARWSVIKETRTL